MNLRSRLHLDSLTGQLIWLVLLILILAQTANTLLLLGDRQLRTTKEQSSDALQRFAEQAARVYPQRQRLLDWPMPQVLSEGGKLKGFVSLARVNRAEAKGEQAERILASQVREALQKQGIDPLTVQASSRAIRRLPRHLNPDFPIPEGMGSERLNPEEMRTGAAPEGPNSSGKRNSDDGLYHPSRPPDRNGAPAAGMREILISAELAPGLWINSGFPYYDREVISARVAWLTAAIAVASILIISLIAGRMTRPLRQLTQIADALGRGQPIDKVPEQGPRDIRTTAIAFNLMQERLSRIIDTQHTLLRAVSHDLRTPMTSLRIRAEAIADEDNREAIIRTLEEMQTMTEDMLAWASDTATTEEISRVELNALLESLIDDYQDQGLPVEFVSEAGAEKLILLCRRVALRRALRNLIDNAIKYAGSAELVLKASDSQLVIEIKDQGPGIPDDQLIRVTQPFVRLDQSRNRHTGGTGLGLSIARSVIESHGGLLSLSNRPEGGLIARIELPR